MPDTRGKHGLFFSVTPGCKSSIVDTLHFEKSTIVNTPTPSVFMSIFSPCFFLAATFHARQQMNFHPCSVCSSLNNMVCGYGSSRLPLPQRPGSVVPRQRPPVCGGPRRPAVSTLGINEHTSRACDAPVNSRRPRVSGGRGSRVEQSAGRCHFVAIAVDIQETAEGRTVCSELSIAPPRLTHCVFTTRAARTSFRFFFFLFCKVS